MGIEKFLFYFFAAILLVAATLVITVRNPVRAALSLVLAFFASAALWMLLEAEFLALVLVLVYVGAVMVLFLFVVMMIDIDLAQVKEGFSRMLPAGIAVAVGLVVVMAVVVGPEHFGLEGFGEVPRHGADYNNTRELGMALFTTFVYPFELAALILLVAIVAAIALTLRRRPGTRHQNPAEQVAVNAAERVRVVKMAAEPRDDAPVPTAEPGESKEEPR